MQLILAVCLLTGINCGPVQPSAEELADPSLALHIQLVSEPPGAAVYGLDGDSIGVYLGVTPMTCQYIYRKQASGPAIYGTEVDQTVTRNLTVEDFLDPPYTFHCWLVKDGYKAHLVYQTLESQKGIKPWNFDTADALKPRTETIRVDLIPLGA